MSLKWRQLEMLELVNSPLFRSPLFRVAVRIFEIFWKRGELI